MDLFLAGEMNNPRTNYTHTTTHTTHSTMEHNTGFIIRVIDYTETNNAGGYDPVTEQMNYSPTWIGAMAIGNALTTRLEKKYDICMKMSLRYPDEFCPGNVYSERAENGTTTHMVVIHKLAPQPNTEFELICATQECFLPNKLKVHAGDLDRNPAWKWHTLCLRCNFEKEREHRVLDAFRVIMNPEEEEEEHGYARADPDGDAPGPMCCYCEQPHDYEDCPKGPPGGRERRDRLSSTGTLIAEKED